MYLLLTTAPFCHSHLFNNIGEILSNRIVNNWNDLNTDTNAVLCNFHLQVSNEGLKTL